MGFIASTPATNFRGRGAVADRSLKAGATVWLSVVFPNVRLLLRFEQPQHGTDMLLEGRKEVDSRLSRALFV
jgi:hypothetical protein